MTTSSPHFRAVIVDDEIMAINNLKLSLKDYPDVRIIGEATTRKDARQLIDTLRPDVVFLDVNLVSGTGFDLLDELSYRDFKLIFVTAHNEFAVRAFEYSAFNYILKPLQKPKIEAAIKALRTSQNKLTPDLLAALTNLINQKEEAEQPAKVALHTPRGMVMKKVDDIICFKSSGNYCFVFLVDDTKILISKTMKEMEYQFEPHNFFRIHHSVLLNCSKVESYKHSEGDVTIDDGQVFKVSYRRRSAFLRHLKGNPMIGGSK